MSNIKMLYSRSYTRIKLKFKLNKDLANRLKYGESTKSS